MIKTAHTYGALVTVLSCSSPFSYCPNLMRQGLLLSSFYRGEKGGSLSLEPVCLTASHEKKKQLRVQEDPCIFINLTEAGIQTDGRLRYIPIFHFESKI